MRHIPKVRKTTSALATAPKAPVSPSMTVDQKLFAALDRISVLERQVSMLLSVMEIGTNGNVRLVSDGTLTLDSAGGTFVRSDAEVVLSGPGGSMTLGLAEVAVEASARLVCQGASVQVSAGVARIDAAMVQASGTVKCETIIATSVVGTSYTPGAGNIW